MGVLLVVWKSRAIPVFQLPSIFCGLITIRSLSYVQDKCNLWATDRQGDILSDGLAPEGVFLLANVVVVKVNYYFEKLLANYQA
jgi:hypothetical protein